MIKRNREERGFSIIEMMTAITLLSILSLAVFNGFGTAAQVIRLSDSSSVQSQLARSKLEELAAVPANNLEFGEIKESSIFVRGMRFERTTNIAAFGPVSRRLKVTVTNTTTGSKSGPISYESVLNPWGLR